MFISNKYTTWYYSIIDNAKNRLLPDDTYTESHHIVPKSLGGTNANKNLVRLTAKEHFVCHTLLVKMVPVEYKKKMIYAFWRMANCVGKRYKPTAKIYEIARKEFIQAQIGHPNYLKFQKPESRERISISMKQTLSELSAEEKSQRMKNSCCRPDSYTPERIENMRKGMLGKKKTKTPELLAAIEARKERNIQTMLKAAENNRGKTWKLINGKRVWMNKEN